jgi:hypothetical protein
MRAPQHAGSLPRVCGNHTTPSIQRLLLLLVDTNTAPAFHGLTNDNIRLQIFGHHDPEQLIFDKLIPHGGPQRYLRRNWHFFDVPDSLYAGCNQSDCP